MRQMYSVATIGYHYSSGVLKPAGAPFRILLIVRPHQRSSILGFNPSAFSVSAIDRAHVLCAQFLHPAQSIRFAFVVAQHRRR